MKKKLFSMLLVAALVLSLLPASALAINRTIYLDGYTYFEEVNESTWQDGQLSITGPDVYLFDNILFDEWKDIPAYESEGPVTVELIADQADYGIAMLGVCPVNFDAENRYYDANLPDLNGVWKGTVYGYDYDNDVFGDLGSISDYEQGKINAVDMVYYTSGATAKLTEPGYYYAYCSYEALANYCGVVIHILGDEPSGYAGFVDVDENDYYAAAVKWAKENNITKGTSETTFSPDATTTRGQVVTFLWRAMGEPAPKTTVNPFKDVRTSDYYYKAVLWAVENGITNGVSAKEFGPGQLCTNAHILTFLWRTMGSPNAGSQTGAGATWYSDAQAWAIKDKLTADTAAEKDINGSCPRADVVTFLYRELAK